MSGVPQFIEVTVASGGEFTVATSGICSVQAITAKQRLVDPKNPNQQPPPPEAKAMIMAVFGAGMVNSIFTRESYEEITRMLKVVRTKHLRD